jgi:hypothetical protein
VVVYAYGAAEGLLLDEIKPHWRDRYFLEKFDLGKLFGSGASRIPGSAKP